MYPHSLLTLLLILLSVSASPTPFLSSINQLVSQANPVTLPLARRVNNTGSANVLQFDQARAKTLRQRAQANGPDQPPLTDAGVIAVPATSRIVSYVTTVSIGNPPQSQVLLIDTGSSNTWVNAQHTWKPNASGKLTGDTISVTYGSGSFKGVECIDSITLAKGLTIHNQSIAVAIESDGFDGVDGILGIGPQDLTVGSAQIDSNASKPTVTDNAYETGLLDQYEVGIAFHPVNTTDSTNGVLTFGGVDTSKFIGPINYVSLTTTAPASNFVGIDQQISYGEQGSVLSESAGILDTGTTLILLATDAFARYREYTGGVPDDDVGLLRITSEQYNNLKSLFFRIGGEEYELAPNAQIWPRVLNEDIGGKSDEIYLIVNDLGSNSGEGLDFINGMSFLERFYMVYDVGGSRAGLAKTPYTYAESN